jgi:hypothetical protein
MRLIRIIGITVGLAVVLSACSSSTNPPAPTSAGTRAPASTSVPATSTAPAAASGLSGTWSGQYGGAYQGTFILNWQESGSQLSGTIKLSSPSQTLSINGIVEGAAISFGTVGSTAITYSGLVHGNSMSGSYKAGNGSNGGSWSATKSS